MTRYGALTKAVAIALAAQLCASCAALSAGTRVITGPEPDQLLLSELIGVEVRSDGRKSVGELKDVLIGGDRVTGLVISIGGFMGLGEKDILLPYDQAIIGAMNRTYGGRAAGGAGAARKPASYTENPQDPAAMDTNVTAGQGRIRPDHLLLPGLTEEALQRAPAWRRP